MVRCGWAHCLPLQQVPGMKGTEAVGAVLRQPRSPPAINHHARLYNYLGT